jgi:hypothetical protein
MKYKIEIPQGRRTPALSFDYDTESGAIEGCDAHIARAFIESAEAARSVILPPYPTAYSIGKTPHAIEEIAAIFASYCYPLPPWLDAHVPRFESDADDDEREFEIVY